MLSTMLILVGFALLATAIAYGISESNIKGGSVFDNILCFLFADASYWVGVFGGEFCHYCGAGVVIRYGEPIDRHCSRCGARRTIVKFWYECPNRANEIRRRKSKHLKGMKENTCLNCARIYQERKELEKMKGEKNEEKNGS